VKWAPAIAGAFLALAVRSDHVGAQSHRDVVGVVVDALEGRPVAGVRVTQHGLSSSVSTDAEGRFTLTGGPAPVVAVRLEHDGYVTEVHEFVIDTARFTLVELAMTPLVALLGELNVVARSATRGPPRANDGSRLRFVDPGASGRHGSVADFLSDRSTGLGLARRSISGGGTTSMRIRGGSSMLDNKPLVILDGVRLEGMEILDQLPLAHVSSIEIVRGPEAMNFGLGAGHGVVVIRTRTASIDR
jgi:TonB-dependent starch-binding outer membrane protein SusC